MASTETSFATVQVMDKWQVTIPEEVRRCLGVAADGHVAFVVENGAAKLSKPPCTACRLAGRLVNPAVYAMDRLRKEMVGAAEKAGITSDEDVIALVKEIRRGKE